MFVIGRICDPGRKRKGEKSTTESIVDAKSHFKNDAKQTHTQTHILTNTYFHLHRQLEMIGRLQHRPQRKLTGLDGQVEGE